MDKTYTWYNNDEERRLGHCKAMRKYATKPWYCNACETSVLLGNRTRHIKTKTHIKK